MRTMKNTCILLLLVGACSALPQYPSKGGVDNGLDQPNQGGDIPVTPQCASNQDCVPYFQCVDGYINTDGAGLLDLRLQPRGTCTQPDYSDVPAICCNIPGIPEPPPFVELCPFQSVCVPEAQCHGSILDTTGTMVPYVSGGSWSTCGDSNIPGVCCANPPPFVELCPFQSVCVPEAQCHGTILDTTGTMVPYVTGGSWSTCGDSNIPGVCCANPPPFVELCPFQSVCVPEGQCHGTILDTTGTMVPYVTGGSWSTCGDSNIPGVCCANPPPPTPAPLTTCPGYKVCVSLGQCDATGNVVIDGSGLLDLRIGGFKQCFVEQTTEVGVCCTPPTTPPPPRQVLDVCPLQSQCMPELLCQDKILDNTGALVPYIPGGFWSECALSGNPNTPGVCCLNPAPEYPVASQCGGRNAEPIIDVRIQSNIEYNEAQFGEFPWQGIIFFSNFTFKCGASLIGDRWLLTAAHCVNGFAPSDFKVRLGEWQVNTFDEPKAYIDVDVAAVTVHPQFNPNNVHNDVAVLQLAEHVVFQYHINSICLPSPGQTFWGQRCISTGWGKDAFDGQYQHIMKKVELPTVENQQCQSLLRKTRLGQYFQLDDSFMCAGGEENEDACKGDGGGPLACQDSVTGQYVLTGITAFGIGCGNKDVPGVYADVQTLLPFVQAVVNGNYDPNTFNQNQQQQPVKGQTVPGYGK